MTRKRPSGGRERARDAHPLAHHRVGIEPLTLEGMLEHGSRELIRDVVEDSVHELVPIADVAPDECEVDIRLSRDVAKRHPVDPPLSEEQGSRVQQRPAHLDGTDRGLPPTRTGPRAWSGRSTRSWPASNSARARVVCTGLHLRRDRGRDVSTPSPATEAAKLQRNDHVGVNYSAPPPRACRAISVSRAAGVESTKSLKTSTKRFGASLCGK